MKICNKCEQERNEIEDFSFRDKNLGIRKDICKKCNKDYHDSYYENNKEKEKKRLREANKKIIERNRDWMRNYIADKFCVDCEEDDLRVLEFDHVRGEKLRPLSTMISEGFSLKKIQEEIDKCEIRCANCHRKRTYDTLGWASRYKLD